MHFEQLAVRSNISVNTDPLQRRVRRLRGRVTFVVRRQTNGERLVSGQFRTVSVTVQVART